MAAYLHLREAANKVLKGEDMNASWIFPFIILGGVLQTCGAAMNAQLFQSLENKWLASAISFTLIMAFFVAAFVMFPHPLPHAAALAKMPWWAPLGGLVGAVQVYAGLTLVQKVERVRSSVSPLPPR